MIVNSDLYDAINYELETSNLNYDEFEKYLRDENFPTLYGKCKGLRYTGGKRTTDKVVRALSERLREFLGRDLSSAILRLENSSKKLYYSIAQDFTDSNFAQDGMYFF